MKISECRQAIKTATDAFLALHQINENSAFSLFPNYNLYVRPDSHPDSKELEFDGIYLATFEGERGFLQWPFHPDNPAIAPEDKAFYRTLQIFGQKVGIPELSETNISFDPILCSIANIKRRMEPPTVFRNQLGEIESVYTLDDLIAIAATFHKAKAVVPINMHPYTIFIGVMDTQPIPDQVGL